MDITNEHAYYMQEENILLPKTNKQTNEWTNKQKKHFQMIREVLIDSVEAWDFEIQGITFLFDLKMISTWLKKNVVSVFMRKYCKGMCDGSFHCSLPGSQGFGESGPCTKRGELQKHSCHLVLAGSREFPQEVL